MVASVGGQGGRGEPGRATFKDAYVAEVPQRIARDLRATPCLAHALTGRRDDRWVPGRSESSGSRRARGGATYDTRGRLVNARWARAWVKWAA